MVIGYTTGVFDLFHHGHVKLLRNARSLCDKLIVGVTVDQLVRYKAKRAVIPFENRMDVVSACRYVDLVVPQDSMDKMAAYEKYKFNLVFVGDDWQGTDRWNEIDRQFADVGVRVVYLPYTKSVSSTLVNETLERLRRGDAE
ncbi:MAG: adenylyltransferase/cytidyltransferase family protein [Gammaproteobacteria bacterium]|nr:adenylyltransferase/cytidyltransferase family protein [Gammaproteobacteria bacterium]